MGSITEVKTFSRLAPRFLAASSMETSKFSRRPSRVMAAMGKKTMVCTTTRPLKP